MLPQFLVIGAYKSGSTAIQEALRAHPQIFLPAKGPSFFAFDEAPVIHRPLLPGTVRDWTAYQALFADAPADAVRGEVSPEYLANPWSCGRIRARVPDVKLVAVLRNPVERAFSDYLMYVRDGDEKLDFAAALDEQGAPAPRIADRLLPRNRVLRPPAPPVLRGLPARADPGAPLRGLPSDPAAVLASMFALLGVDPGLGSVLSGPSTSPASPATPSSVPSPAAASASRRSCPRPCAVARRPPWSAASTAPPWDRLRSRLVEIYREDVAELERLLERPLGHWLDDPPRRARW